EGGQRLPCRRARPGPAPAQYPGQDQSDPVQSLARHRLRMLRVGDDRALRRHRQPGRLRLADPHPARARHPCRLRPAQERKRAAADPRAAGAFGHAAGRGGVTGLAIFLRLLFLAPAGFIAAIVTAALVLTWFYTGWSEIPPGPVGTEMWFHIAAFAALM